MADNNKMPMILTWFSVTITSQLVMAVAACNINFVKVYMIAYCAHVYTGASLIRIQICLIEYSLNKTI